MSIRNWLGPPERGPRQKVGLPSVSGTPTNAPNQIYQSGVCDCYLVSHPPTVRTDAAISRSEENTGSNAGQG
jgi:hypothetical protein